MRNCARWFVTAIFFCVLVTTPFIGRAADALAFGPAPGWVQAQQAPSSAPGGADAPLRILLSDAQMNLAPTVSESYFDSVLLIQSPEGLANAGSVTLSWRPETDVLTVHKLSIFREGKEIDVLASGQTFSILRREDLLEYAVLSGVLTAVIQPEGLRVGDRVELAYTLKRSDPLLGGVPEQILATPAGVPIARAHLRALWPAKYRMTWQPTPFIDGVKSGRVGDTFEVSATRDNDEPLVQPSGAPARFAAMRLIQITGHTSWAEISKLVYPLFDRASKLSPTSPLQAEVARIRNATPDAQSRVEAVLRLVQDQIRYVYLGMNDAPLVPADIDTTWSRRYGDCKAKTAVLLAFLRELGVDAEPVAVSFAAGDALPTRLPMIQMMDHVLVRATLGGKIYWLDGTRSGDRRLEDLPTPRYAWGLPLRAAGAGLLKIDVPPLSVPTPDTTIFVDASAGTTMPAKFRAETVLRGDAAVAMQRVLSGFTDKQRETGLRGFWTQQRYWSNNWNDVTLRDVKAEFDDASGRLRLSMEGEGVMNWQGDQHLMGALSLGAVVNLKREPGPNSDAPFLTTFPIYQRVRERIKLPNSGNGFKILGADIERTIAGIHYQRTASIENGELSTEVSARSLQPEFPASEAPAAQKALREMWDNPLYAVLPKMGLPRTMPSTWGLDSLSSCVPTVTEAAEGDSSRPANVARPALKLVTITPAAGSKVGRESVLAADLEYGVPEFEPSRFTVFAQFDMNKDGMSTDGTFKNYPILQTPVGKIHFCFPLRHVWDGPDIKRPFSVRFFLNKRVGEGRSVVIASTERMIFPEDDSRPVLPDSPDDSTPPK